MTADAKNNGTLICGVVSVETVNDGKIAKFRVAADYAGKDTSDPENRTGYFDVVLYQDDNPNNKFVFKQITEGKMSKGSQIAIAYRLHNARWKADDGSGRQRTELVAEAITYVGGGAKKSDDETSSSSGGSESDGGASVSSANSGGAVPQKF